MKKEFGRAISIILASAVAITSFCGLPTGKLHTQAASVKVKSPRIAEDGTVTWDKVTFGTYPQDLEKIIEEPIKWRILSVNDNGTNALVVADKGLAPKPFDESGTHNTWADCSLRTWLNDENDPDSFINTAFTAEERALIKTTTLENKKPDGTTACSNTTDKIFLLSWSDVAGNETSNTETENYWANSYGFEHTTYNNYSRGIKVTDYSHMTGCSRKGRSSNRDLINNCSYWLRTTGKSYDKPLYVREDGAIMDAYIYYDVSDFAVRPAMYIDLTSSYVTDAGTVHAYYSGNGSPDNEPDPDKDKSEYNNPRYATGGSIDAYNTIWDCVYFGKFKQSTVFTESPIEWRVLSVEGNEAVLLAEDGLICIEYDLTNNYYGNLRLEWPNANLRSWLNEDDPDSYPDEPPFINTAFNEAEKKAIIETKHVFPDGISDTIESVDKVYLLSVDELKDPVYGFVDEDGEYNSDSLKAEPSDYAFFRQCNGVFKENTPDPIKWWLSDTFKNNDYWYASCVNENGRVIDFDTFKENPYSVKASERGDSSVAVRPAIHVDLSSPCVQFAGRVNSRGETQTAEEILNLPVTAATITTQPKGQKLNWGYKETTPLTVAADDIAGHSLSYMWYQSDSKDTGKGTPINGAVEKSYTIPAGADTGTKYYYCAVTSTRLENGQTKTVYSDFAEVTVEKVSSSVTKAPVAVTDLKYTGQPIALVLAGTANGGAIQYALGADDKTPPAADAYSASVPTATDAGTYHVWYMSFGDKNHTDSVAECVTVVVAKGESRDPKNPSDQPTDPADPVTQPKPVVVPVKTEVQVGDETISLNIQTSLKNEVTYTGKTIDPEKDLDMKVDTRSLTDAVKIPAGVKAEQLIAVTYIQTNARNASVVKDKKATVYPKLKVTKKAKKKLSSSDYKKLKKLVAAANSALQNNTCEYTINPLPLKDCQVEVHAKLKKKKIQIKNGKLKGLKSVKIKIPGAKKKTTLGSGMYEIGSPDKENGTVSVTGRKNYTGTVTVTVKK